MHRHHGGATLFQRICFEAFIHHNGRVFPFRLIAPSSTPDVGQVGSITVSPIDGRDLSNQQRRCKRADERNMDRIRIGFRVLFREFPDLRAC